MSTEHEAAAIRAVFGSEQIPDRVLRPQAAIAARELWRYDVPVPRIAELLRLSVPAVRSLLLSTDVPRPARFHERGPLRQMRR